MIDFIDETGSFTETARLLDVLHTWLAELGLEGRELALVLLDDEAIRTFNQRDRQLDETTDVLSYPAAEPDDRFMPVTDHLGDVLISLETAGRQALEHGHSLLEEVLVLAAHGITHLLGYDHATEAEWRIFRTAQSRVIQLAGLHSSH